MFISNGPNQARPTLVGMDYNVPHVKKAWNGLLTSRKKKQGTSESDHNHASNTKW